MEIIDRVKTLIASYLDENGIELIDVIYRREQAGMCLRLLVDTPEGISLDECERLNNYLSELLDKEEGADEHYLLEVSSPGLDRPILTDADFRRTIGKEIYITVYEPVDSKKEHSGKLIGMDGENVVIESKGVSIVIPRQKIARAKRKIEF